MKRDIIVFWWFVNQPSTVVERFSSKFNCLFITKHATRLQNSGFLINSPVYVSSLLFLTFIFLNTLLIIFRSFITFRNTCLVHFITIYFMIHFTSHFRFSIRFHECSTLVITAHVRIH